jgi:acetyl esterase/lipase
MNSSPAQPVFPLILLLTFAAFAWPGQASAEPLPPGTRVQRNLPYGPDPAQRMDVYSPPNPQNAPVLLMVHGGGWRRGDKAYPNVVNNKVAHWLPQGYIVISINYRMLPKANPLQQADDLGKALAYAQAHAPAWGANPAHFILMGHSSGAHLVSLLTADPTIATAQGAKPWLGTVSLDSAAYNVVAIMQARHFGLYDQAFGTDPSVWRKASPLLRLTKAAFPMLLVCSTRRLDSPRQAQAFADKDNALGGHAKLLPEDLDHGQINANLGLPGDYTKQVDAFLRSLLSKQEPGSGK